MIEYEATYFSNRRQGKLTEQLWDRKQAGHFCQWEKHCFGAIYLLNCTFHMCSIVVARPAPDPQDGELIS